MKILGLDTSGLVAGVAVVENDTLVGEFTTDYKKTHSQTLLPMLDWLRDMIELDLDTLDAVAVASGPGSFTGLRIGSATAKGLGLALRKPLVEVPTLEGLAWNLWGTGHVVCPLMDARRNQVYTAAYAFHPSDEGMELETLLPGQPMDVALLCGRLSKMGRSVIFLGDGVPVYHEVLKARMQTPFLVAPAGCNRQRAANIAALGAVYYARGRGMDAALHQPEYFRKSQAEQNAESL